ncbi:MAG: trypsin-like serine protease [Bdellovibrionales bacterium]
MAKSLQYSWQMLRYLILTSILSISPAAVAISTQAPATELSPALMRSVVALRGPDNTFECSGIIIKKKEILTAAHCFKDQPNLEAVFFDSFGNIQTVIPISAVNPHPQFEEHYKEYTLHTERFLRVQENVRDILRPVFDGKIEKCEIEAEGLRTWGLYELLRGWMEQNAGLVKKYSDSECVKRLTSAYNILDLYFKTEAKEWEIFEQKDKADIAIALLSREIDSNHEIVDLDFNFDFTKSSQTLVLAGFGNINEDKSVHTFNAGYVSNWKALPNDKIEITGNTQLCHGDSGGFTGYLKNGKLISIAVNSGRNIGAAHSCELEDTAFSSSVRLDKYKDWLLKQLVND